MTRVALTAGLAVLAALSGCKKAACDSAQLKKVQDALASVDAEARSQLVGVGIVESCTNPERPMPTGLSKALRAASELGPHATLGVVRGLADSVAEWTAACPAGPGALASAAQAAPGEASQALVTACNAGASGLGSADELGRVAVPQLALALTVHRWMVDGGVNERQAKALARTVAGL